MRYLLFILLFLGCAHVSSPDLCGPGWALSETYRSSCIQGPPPDDVARYMVHFKREWALDSSLPQNPEALDLAFAQIQIHWQSIVFTKPGRDQLLLGLTYGVREGIQQMYVYQPPECNTPVCNALGHELVHVAYGALTGDMIANHLHNGREWPPRIMALLQRVEHRYHHIKL